MRKNKSFKIGNKKTTTQVPGKYFAPPKFFAPPNFFFPPFFARLQLAVLLFRKIPYHFLVCKVCFREGLTFLKMPLSHLAVNCLVLA